MNALDALYDNASTVKDDQALSRIAQLLAEEADTIADKETGEAMASAAKLRLHEIYTKSLPDALTKAGVADFTDLAGNKVELGTLVEGALGSAKTAEEWKEKNRKLDLIEEAGGGDILKLTVSIELDKGETALAALVSEKAAAFIEAQKKRAVVKTERSVHHQTLLKWMREKLEKGEAVPIEDLGFYHGPKAKVIRPKTQERQNNG